MSRYFAAGFASGVINGVTGKTAAMKAKVTLQPQQEDAKKKSRGLPGMILNWGLGSGKTIASLAIAEDRGGEVLVVLPAALRENFRKELEDTVTKKRQKAYTIISYDAFRKAPDAWIKGTKPYTVITDEYHRLRNPKPREPFELVRDDIPFMLGLTGSLVNNRPEEVVPLVNLSAGKDVFKSVEEFRRRHISEKKVGPGLIGRLKGAKPGVVESIKNKKELGDKLSPYVHRFSGDETYKKEIPSVTESVVRVEMSPVQEKMYKALAAANPVLAYKMRHNLPPSKRDARNLNAFLTAARQIANTPAGYTTEVDVDSPKFTSMLDEIKSQAKKDKNFKAVIYSNFLESGVVPLVSALNEAGVASTTFTGGLKDKERRKVVRDFNAGKIKVLGLSPAGGEGLDLKGVKLIQLVEEHWNPERGRQAIGRGTRYKSHAHLPEGERSVSVQRFLAIHKPSFWDKILGSKPKMSTDEWINQRRLEKLELNKDLFSAIPEFGSQKAAHAYFLAGFLSK